MPITPKTKITRLPQRGNYDEKTIYGILDEALFCTLSYAVDGQPFSMPTGFCRVDNFVYIHGSVGSGYMRQMAAGIPVCITATLLDAFVLAKSVFHHSMNYRSVVAFATPTLVADEDERMKALEAFTEKLIPGRWADCRQPNASEMKKTMVLKFSLDEASAKLRQAPPSDDEEDEGLPYWSGLIHIKRLAGEIEPDAITKEQNIAYPGYFGL
jgi:uncharacterized protein